MKLKAKLSLVTSITVSISVALITIFAIYNYKRNVKKNIESYRQEETEKVKRHLRDIVNIAYDLVTVGYQKANDSEYIKRFYSQLFVPKDSTGIDSAAVYDFIQKDILKQAIENIRVLRYAGDGYIWINNVSLPYRVVMHPLNPELEGKKLDGPEFNVVKGTKQNIYAAFAEICNRNGAGYLEYEWFKPGEIEKKPKISYIRLFEPKGWVIGAGVYIDNIDKVIFEKSGDLKEQVNQLIAFIIVVGLLLIIFATWILYKMGDNITKAIYVVKDILYDIAQGRTVEKMKKKRSDEIGEMEKSVNALIDGISAYSKFANEIRKGNFAAQFESLSEEDELGNSLVNMRASLQMAKEEDAKRKEKDRKQNWVSDGLAKFGDILRIYIADSDKLADLIIENLIEYLEANQGGIFILNNENEAEPYLELKASYAYDRKKYHERKIKLKEGLIGTCAIEKELIYMTNIPQDYVKITSGLGKATPRNLLIVPLKVEEELLGVIELVSFHIFEPYQIQFVEKTAESIASALQSVKISSHTENLLRESQIQAEEKSKQEKQMQQVIAELQHFKKEASEKENKMIYLINAIESSLILAKFDLEGYLQHANKQFLNFSSYRIDEVKGEHISQFIHGRDRTGFRQQWEQLLRGGKHIKIDLRFKTKYEETWLLVTFSPIRNNFGKINQILFLADNISERKKQEEEVQAFLEQMQEKNIKLSFEEMELKQRIEELRDEKKELSKLKVEQEKLVANLKHANDEQLIEIERIKHEEISKSKKELESHSRRYMQKVIALKKELTKLKSQLKSR